jgi:hypothetical protein
MGGFFLRMHTERSVSSEQRNSRAEGHRRNLLLYIEMSKRIQLNEHQTLLDHVIRSLYRSVYICVSVRDTLSASHEASRQHHSTDDTLIVVCTSAMLVKVYRLHLRDSTLGPASTPLQIPEKRRRSPSLCHNLHRRLADNYVRAKPLQLDTHLAIRNGQRKVCLAHAGLGCLGSARVTVGTTPYDVAVT